MDNGSSKPSHFGYRRVEESRKQPLVNSVFDSVAPKYDLMNDLMSFGLHRVWKRIAVAYSGVRENSVVLDVAGGTGDIALALAKKLGPDGRLVLCDINSAMLRIGQDRIVDKGHVGRAVCVQANAERLAFAENVFDCVTISFGLRNVTRIDDALSSMYEVTRPGGRLLVLEFSKPAIPLLARLYDAYSFNVIPRLGKAVANDRESYQYLVESIRRHPDQETLADMIAVAGFECVEYFNLTGGIVALHVGRKI